MSFFKSKLKGCDHAFSSWKIHEDTLLNVAKDEAGSVYETRLNESVRIIEQRRKCLLCDYTEIAIDTQPLNPPRFAC